MADSALARMENLPVSIASLGLLYCKTDGNSKNTFYFSVSVTCMNIDHSHHTAAASPYTL